MQSKKLALIIGSLRKQSINRQVAEYICSQLPAHIEVEEINIATLPLYNQDYDQQQIDSYDAVRKQIKNADAILIVTPEHNRTLPAALKNIIDIGSRPHGDSAWDNKKIAIATASPGRYGAINCGVDLRKVMHSLHTRVMNQPEVYLNNADKSLSNGAVSDEHTQAFLQKFSAALTQFIEE
ncbi:NADPH-dependent FMN reductase [Psychrobacter sp. FDAARGOS_221]|uniref:NADPH-dependent FMN reductase n=1 Tax=Psychrobacter sp. FDAARGOS_221 TaxID=1975705 RepID=UPI000BB54AFB|nr:NAD(P)H-dependent oxidoreductase [Psychrobacter sp. FDAARGOS_221]PNK60672.1 NAD(P)H-dependent oxidoreductase [Psychrobacter sp. FDAARGOS_221]